MLSQDGKVWETKDRARTMIDVRKVPGWDLPFQDGEGNADEDRRKQQPRFPSWRLPRSMSIKAAGWFQIIRIRVFLA